MKLGEALKAYRLSTLMHPSGIVKGASLQSIADQIGISKATLSRIERGYECDSTTLMRIFNYLTCPATGAHKEK
jgi:transcriptional regulator with XRE-family HTH domain